MTQERVAGVGVAAGGRVEGRDLERYDELVPGARVRVRVNDAGVPVGASGVVLGRASETGNWIVGFGEAGRSRVVALCPWQVRPEEVEAPEPEPAVAHPGSERLRLAWSRMSDPETRARAIEAHRAFHEQRHRRIEESGVRECGRCGEARPLSEFNRRSLSGGRVGYQGYCRACIAAWVRERRAAGRPGAEGSG